VVAGLGIATERDELNVAHTRMFNGAAGYHALAVGQQDNLEHDAWIVRARADFIIFESRIHGLEVKLMFDQIVQCKCKTTGNNLFR